MLRNTPAVAQCMVRKLYMHAVGRVTVQEEDGLLSALNADFAAAEFDYVALMKNIALTHGFRATSGPLELTTDASE